MGQKALLKTQGTWLRSRILTTKPMPVIRLLAIVLSDEQQNKVNSIRPQ